MAKSREIRVPANQIPVSRRVEASIAVVGNPNSGKSTVFNRLTGLRQRIGNYPGVTVERHVGTIKVDDRKLELVDLPGTYGLSAHSFEEQIAIDVIFGRIKGTRRPDGIVAVVDATSLYQGMYLVQQLLELECPLVIALTMTDAALTEGLRIDVDALSRRLGVVEVADTQVHPVEIERLLIEGAIDANKSVLAGIGSRAEDALHRKREELFGREPPLAKEARVRYRWVRSVINEVQHRVPVYLTWHSRVATFMNRPIPGTAGLFVVMAIVFQAVFAWATPVMNLIDSASASLGAVVSVSLGEGAFASLIADGIIAGVGSVVIFLPQIIILFLFIILLEDSGYLARAAYLLDRAMRSVGLSGQSIIPMISSFACAVPGIMATRVIPNRRDRIATIMAAPFMTCSARLPVYALLIAAFVPAQKIGFMNLQGLVLLGLYVFGIVAGVLTALLMRKTALRGPKPPFALMLPAFRRPNLRTVLMQLLGRAKVFLHRAGTVIFTVAIIVWALAYYPRSDAIAPFVAAKQQEAERQLPIGDLEAAYADIDHRAAAMQLEQSWLGRAGHFIEPVFAPLGWDWRVSSAVIAGFPAREVVIAVLGTVYAVGDAADESTLSDRLKSTTWPDGSPVFTLPMVFGLLIFYACCLQCAATLAVIRRETNSWRWPVFAWCYMTAIGYTGALLVFQLGS